MNYNLTIYMSKAQWMVYKADPCCSSVNGKIHSLIKLVITAILSNVTG